jgi:hypothetical protein
MKVKSAAGIPRRSFLIRPRTKYPQVRMKRTSYLLPLMPLALAGCYSYTPIAPAAVPAGSEVRVRITGAASDRVAPLIGSLDTRVLIGNVIENNRGELVIEVPNGAMPNVLTTVVPLNARVPLGPVDLVSLEQRKLDVARTSVFAGVVTAGIALGAYAAIHAGGGGGDVGRTPGEPPPINRIPIPIWRFHF